MSTMVAAAIRKRAQRVLEKLQPWLPPDYGWAFFLSGSAIASPNPAPRDIDIFTQTASPRLILRAPIVAETANATTYGTEPWPAQVCNFHAVTLKHLLAQFDFTHTQAGVSVRTYQFEKFQIESVHYTPEYVEDRACGTTRYIRSPNPLTSILRVGKYYQRGEITRDAYVRGTLAAMAALVQQGFTDREDFRKQLLGLSQDWELFESDEELQDLFTLLRRDCDVKSTIESQVDG